MLYTMQMIFSTPPRIEDRKNTVLVPSIARELVIEIKWALCMQFYQPYMYSALCTMIQGRTDAIRST